MNIIVCDDVREDRVALCTLVRRFFREINCPVKINACKDGESLLGDLGSYKTADAKICFLDIYMPGINGIDVARKIRETDSDTVIILTTTSLDHGVEGYSVYAFQYLVKPLRYPDVNRALGKCVKLFEQAIRFIEVVSDRLKVRVPLKDILYIEVLDHVCLIHTLADTTKSYCPLDEIEQQLDNMGEHTFLRIHRSYIVNMRHIDDVAENDFLMRNGAAVPIRRKDKLEVKQAYRDHLFSLARGM